MLRELSDFRLDYHLQFRATPSFVEPWARRINSQIDMVILVNAMPTGLIVLYHFDDKYHDRLVGTLIHAWLHLLAFKSWWATWRFKRANMIKALPPLPLESTNLTDRKTPIYEAWSILGELLLGFD